MGEEAAVARLPEELADKEVLGGQVRQTMADLASQKRHRRINLTDADARLMKGRQDIVAGYNAQAMVSPMATDGGATSMLVTAVDVVDAANDNALLVPMTLADAGYFAASHLAECDRRGQQVVVSEARQRFLEDPYHKDRFTYEEHSDSFRCPQGQTLASSAYSMRTESRCVCTGLQVLSVRHARPSEPVPEPKRLGEAWP